MIVMSSVSHRERLEAAIRKGARDYIAEPFDIDLLRGNACGIVTAYPE